MKGKLLIFFISINLIPQSTFSLSPHRFYVGPDVYYRDYNENLDPPKKSHEFGPLYGVQMGYSYIKPNCYYFGLDLRVSGGQTTYNGSLIDLINHTITPFNSTTNNGFVNLEARVGKTLQNGRFHYIPFIGLGGHYWYRGLIQNNPYGFSEIYTWGYFAFGIQTQCKFNKTWSFGMNLKAMQMFSGTMFASGLNNAIFNLGNVLQYEIELPINYTPNNSYFLLSQISLVPYFRNQNIGKSNSITTNIDPIGQVSFYEPSSTTYVGGVRLEFAYNF